ncbi:glycosyltransferase [Kutzneria chonburiensis]|uniref:Glycosyltransferase n=1 Tax=Kutzneria chonburiensis TaxID=1483604 RepID=A0ABV6N359_9PSEU|nr:glycosyltransferase [Kutzneria chonburiensis]
MTSSEVGYADGAESEVLLALKAAEDISAGSTELAAKVDSWETAYHFSPQRLALLAPLRLRPELRAVDLGCGTGVLTRALGEAGLDVLGIEGTEDRAAAASERCRDLPNVRIVRGEIEQELAAANGIDLAVLCGVLEYSTLFGAGPERLLDGVRQALSERGVVALAIENQLGVGYLLGRPEDHHGKSWVGIADYPGGEPQPRTWTRQKLASLLADAGLTAQRWLLPYPDYKLPRVVLNTALFDRPDAPELVEKLVRDPLRGAFGGGRAVAPGRELYRAAVAEGFGVEVAPSFLILASASEEPLDELLDPSLAWLVSGGRRPEWRRTRGLGRDLVLTSKSEGTTGRAWLRQQTVPTEPWFAGRPLDAALLDALRGGDSAELRRLVTLWQHTVLAQARPLTADDERHPYLPGRDGVAVLPPDHLDVHPGNLILTATGVERVDREWLAGTGVDAELVQLRSLLEFAHDIHDGGAPHIWGSAATERDLLRALAELVGLSTAADERWSELLDAEGELQSLVTGTSAATISKALHDRVDQPGIDPLWTIQGGLDQIVADATHLKGLEQSLRDADADLDRHRTALVDANDRTEVERRRGNEVSGQLSIVEQELSVARAEAARLDRRLGMVFAELADAALEAESAQARSAQLEQQAAHVADRLAKTRARLDALENAKIVRAAHRYLWPSARIARGVRDIALGRAGDEGDAVLRRSGPLAGVFGARMRKSARPKREAELHYSVNVPERPIAVGRGQVVDLDGWVVNAGIAVKDVRVLFEGEWHVASTGHARPDVVAALGPSVIRTPEGCGFRVRLPLTRIAAPMDKPLALGVLLADGTLLRRELPPLRLVPSNLDPVTVSWPGKGPKVAICMATYRPDPAFLAAQLDSIRAQTHDNWVCVLSDDNSGPESLAVIRRLITGDDRFVLVAHEDNVGFYGNFERALAAAPADAHAVALADQDDVWDPDKLVTLLLALREHGLAYSDMRLIDEQDTVFADSFWQDRRNQWTDLEALLLLNTVTGAASMVDGKTLRELVLPFPPGTPSAFHDQWIAATALADSKLAFVDRALYSYRQHGQAVTGHRQERLDKGLPGKIGLALLALGRNEVLTAEQEAQLEAVAEYELRRVAQFATTLLLRVEGMKAEDRERLTELSEVENRRTPLLKLAGRAREETAGAERFLLSAALRWHALRKARGKIPPLAQPSID